MTDKIISFESGIDFVVYAELSDAEGYVLGMATTEADAWRDATDTVKQRALVTATRRFESQCWAGEKASATQSLKWPRSGLTYADGTEVDESVIPDEVMNAAIELAVYIVDGTFQATKDNFNKGIKRLKADTAEIEYFTPQFSNAGAAYPKIITDLAGRWMCGNSLGGSSSYGTDKESDFTDGWTFNRGF